MKSANSVLKKVLEIVKPSEGEISEIKKSSDKFCGELKKRAKKLGLNVEVFIGGSFAKKTIIKKDVYDVDIFLRFDKSHENISELSEKILSGIKKTRIHGSRDYFEVKNSGNSVFEIIPIAKIKNPREARNITDLSYFHVNYIRKKLKKKIHDEIILAKAFCYANDCYGAESYVNGFSGYALELLICHYKSFAKMARTIANAKERIIIDDGKHFKNKNRILTDLNSSKLKSPAILIDPTYKQRNALAALSDETFEKFKKTCAKFLKNPSVGFFEKKKPDFEIIGKNALKAGNEFVRIRLSTSKQKGDIAGSKMKKFYEFFEKEIARFFIVKNRGFLYKGADSAECFFSAKRKKEIIFDGPRIDDAKNAAKFRAKHKSVFSKKKRLFAKKKIDFTLKEFLEIWKRKNRKQMEEMSISRIEVV